VGGIVAAAAKFGLLWRLLAPAPAARRIEPLPGVIEP
jgi:hypothetical protein